MVRTPVILLRIPFHIGITNSVLYVIQPVSGVFQYPLVVLFSKRHAGEAVSHGNVLTAVGEAVSSVSVIYDSPDIFIGISGKDAVTSNCHICAQIIEAAIFR